jgi:hypothetical protein
MRKISWLILAAMAVLVGLYPTVYFLVDKKFGLLSTKSAELLHHAIWNLGFYTHIILGGFALLIGWSQFSQKHSSVQWPVLVLRFLPRVVGLRH